VRVEVDRPESLDGASLAAWRTIQQTHAELSRASLCPEFVLAVAAARGDVFVASIEEDGRTVGFFPFQRYRADEGLPPGYGISNTHGAIADPSVPWDARELIKRCRLASWYFDHLVPSAPFDPYYTTFRNECFIDVAAGFDAYTQKRRQAGSKEIAKLERKTRKLEKEVGPVEFALHTDDPALLNTLMNWKSAQYKRTRFVDRFAIPWVVETVQRIHGIRTEDFGGLLAVLWVDGAPVALNMTMRSHSALELWFSAYDHAYAKYSPGLILRMKLAQHAPALGLATVELGRSGAAYKERLMSGERAQAVGCVQLLPSTQQRPISDRLLRTIPGDRVSRVRGRLEERRLWRSLDPKR